jgi:hypothetical protein
MSVFGPSRTFGDVCLMSAIEGKGDIAVQGQKRRE